MDFCLFFPSLPYGLISFVYIGRKKSEHIVFTEFDLGIILNLTKFVMKKLGLTIL